MHKCLRSILCPRLNLQARLSLSATLRQIASNFDKNELSKLNFDLFDVFENDSSSKIKNTDIDADQSLESILKVTNNVDFNNFYK